eukprot:sb/3474948/
MSPPPLERTNQHGQLTLGDIATSWGSHQVPMSPSNSARGLRSVRHPLSWRHSHLVGSHQVSMSPNPPPYSTVEKPRQCITWEDRTLSPGDTRCTIRSRSKKYRTMASTHQEPTETSKQQIRTRYLGHVTGY